MNRPEIRRGPEALTCCISKMKTFQNLCLEAKTRVRHAIYTYNDAVPHQCDAAYALIVNTGCPNSLARNSDIFWAFLQQTVGKHMTASSLGDYYCGTRNEKKKKKKL